MKNKIKVLWCLFLIAGCSACTNPAWEEHYSSKVDEILDMTLLDAIQKEADLSTFLVLLEKTGYDKKLATSQSYTLWAPVNSALIGVDTSDVSAMTIIVTNHISRFPYPTSGIVANESVRMLGNKLLPFTTQGGDYYFGKQKVLNRDITCNNGILHTIDGCEPYLRNLWEFMRDMPGYDSLYSYLNSYEVFEFDERNSENLGPNEFGQTEYDSIFNYSNVLLAAIGRIKTEDSIYSMIMPSNIAWGEMYDSIRQFFQYDTTSLRKQADSLQDAMTKSYIVSNLVYRSDLTPEDIQASPTLISTSNTLIEDPAAFFAGAVDTALSNGRAYRMDRLNIPSNLWCPKLVLEAENFAYHTPDTVEYKTRKLYRRNAFASLFRENISQESFLDVVPQSATTKPYITFAIPHTRSVAYNIYCVFLPLNINSPNMDTTQLLPTKVRFTLSYVNPSGKLTSRTYSNNKLYTTNPRKIDTMLITQKSDGTPQPFKLPYANYGEGKINVSLRLTSAVENKEFLEYTREMLIDCIIFEPVY